jgi:transcription initiation factor TFIIF subunit alpha
MFVFDNGRFRMVPIEKWYRFNPTGRVPLLSLVEAEAFMEKREKNPRWFMDNEHGREKKRAELARQDRLTRGRVGTRGENRVKDEDDDDNENVDVADDVDELDFEAEDEFQDDDEGKLFGDDEEEAKEAASKIKKERHEANIFAGTGVKDEKDWDEEEQLESKKEREEKKKAKKLRKKLIKIEKNYDYDDDESDNPYSEEVSLVNVATHRMRSKSQSRKNRTTRTSNVNAKKTNARRRKNSRPMTTNRLPRCRPTPTLHQAVLRSMAAVCNQNRPCRASSVPAHLTCQRVAVSR